MNSADVVAGTNALAAHYNNLRKDVKSAVKDLQTATDAATVTFNLANGAIQKVTLGGNRTLALSGQLSGQSFAIILIQDGSGNRTVTWWSNIKWISSTVPTLTISAGGIDIFTFFYDGTNYYGTVVGQNYG
jgi:hypothetical protein